MNAPMHRFSLATLASLALISMGGCGGSSGVMVVPDVTKTNDLNLVATRWSGVGGHLPSGLEDVKGGSLAVRYHFQ